VCVSICFFFPIDFVRGIWIIQPLFVVQKTARSGLHILLGGLCFSSGGFLPLCKYSVSLPFAPIVFYWRSFIQILLCLDEFTLDYVFILLEWDCLLGRYLWPCTKINTTMPLKNNWIDEWTISKFWIRFSSFVLVPTISALIEGWITERTTSH